MSVRWTYAFLDRPAAVADRAGAFWAAVTGARLSEPSGDNGEFITLTVEGADACAGVQRIVSGEGGVHLDFSVEDIAGFAAAARRLGAGTVAEHEGWSVLRSPAGQLFCAIPWHGESVRPPVVRGSRLDQVCLDLAPSLYDAEVAFWGGLLADWESAPGSLPEFHVVRPPAGLPVRVLLQRLEQERPVSAHPDLACADIGATRARHEELGASFVTAFDHWTVMRDPAGGLYCLTGRDPWTGGLAAPPDGSRA
ncbi:VOC family protein [Streptomyces sp. NPDC086080]|uniref:VOC family protein n=1 Tax=Streptomyces sp. NPDC086080 TaxID=3365748 RepID=UPI0037CE8D6D